MADIFGRNYTAERVVSGLYRRSLFQKLCKFRQRLDGLVRDPAGEPSAALACVHGLGSAPSPEATLPSATLPPLSSGMPGH